MIHIFVKGCTGIDICSVYFTISFLVLVIVFGQKEGTLVVFAVLDVSDIVKI